MDGKHDAHVLHMSCYEIYKAAISQLVIEASSWFKSCFSVTYISVLHNQWMVTISVTGNTEV